MPLPLRTLTQNARYWAGVVPLAAEQLRRLGITPCDEQAAHDLLKEMFLSSPFTSTTRLDADAFERYARRCREWVRGDE